MNRSACAATHPRARPISTSIGEMNSKPASWDSSLSTKTSIAQIGEKTKQGHRPRGHRVQLLPHHPPLRRALCILGGECVPSAAASLEGKD